MVQLPKNCKIVYGEKSVFVTMVYATSLPVGEHNGVKVFKSPYSKRNYLELIYKVDYQNNMPHIVKQTYFEYKKKAMLFNRMQKQQKLQQEINILASSQIPGTWDLLHLKGDNQLTLNL